MPPSSLDGASKYLNNLLLARGFLQDGKAIDFAQLACDNTETKNGTFDRNATTARIVNLVHDLVLRRDRDAEQREALASNIRTLRAEESQWVLDFQRLQDKNIQLKNDLSTSEAQQRTLTVSAKKAHAETKELKEQMLKMKSTLDQVRAKCISDIRKRDVELDKLKSHLSGLNRGKKESTSGGMKINTINVQPKSGNTTGRNSQDNNASEWTLENETNDFLAAVVNETSTENVALRKIVGDSMRYLSTLTGLDDQQPQKEKTDTQNAIGIPGQYRDRGESDPAASTPAESLIPVQSLASSMSEVLSHCHTILRDPSFVPIEEVQARDEEIAKLRAGWEKMADRWKEAVGMMTQWRQKMIGDQEHSQISAPEMPDTLEAEGLSGIAAFGRSVATRPSGQPVLDPIEEEELTSMLMDYHSKIGNQSMISNDAEVKDSHIVHDETLPEPDETGTPRQQPIHVHEDAGGEESDLDISEKAPPQIIASPARRGIKLHKPAEAQSEQRQPLSNTNANPKKRKSATTSSSPRKRRSVSPATEPTSTKSRASTKPSSTIDSSMNMSTDTTDHLHFDTLTSDISGDEEDPFAPDAEEPTNPKTSRMTVALKLAVVEAEATEATEVIRRRQATTYSKNDRRAKDRAKAGAKAVGKPAEVSQSAKNVEKKGTRGTERVKKVKDRRRSTLTPAELGSLMGR
ncbi:hypothetical protein PMZ80_002457 [Knufia obscura]|uniref:Afadin and alpha-actinin-binding-domain-containing protein n=2 Tax=Knufia TaxID=430999 RepID=A0AAN8EAS8_9EURO|nr:hypothetical protein PMZ80_002457 [Knufia obscura]KAK5950834.1 hypothetical protein OHC33_008217 [Knufia fluminis]